MYIVFILFIFEIIIAAHTKLLCAPMQSNIVSVSLIIYTVLFCAQVVIFLYLLVFILCDAIRLLKLQYTDRYLTMDRSCTTHGTAVALKLLPALKIR